MLLTNRSNARFMMESFEESLKDAEAALALNNTYDKVRAAVQFLETPYLI